MKTQDLITTYINAVQAWMQTSTPTNTQANMIRAMQDELTARGVDLVTLDASI